MKLAPLIKGKRVAVIGRAGSILGTGNGARIDRADFVIRVNWLLPIPEEQVVDVGSKTNLVYTCLRCATSRKQAAALKIPNIRLSSARRIKTTKKWFPMSPKVRASTGFDCVWRCVQAGARRVELYGFDLFRSVHFQERCPDGNSPYGSARGRWLHNWGVEEEAWRRLIEAHPVVKPDPIFRAALWPVKVSAK